MFRKGSKGKKEMKRKKIREKGKLRLSRIFQKLEKGDKVAVVREVSVKGKFPERLQGRVGVIEGRRGKAYIVKIIEGKQEKKFIIEPIHLKKLKK